MRLIKFLQRLFKNRYFYYLKYRYRSYPRHKEARVRLLGKTIKVPDMASYMATYDEIFIKGIYEFESNNAEPIVFDVGANIGLSIVFFKSIHPDARIIAFEPDKVIFEYLKYNVGVFDLENVELINAAAWIEDTELEFLSDGADGGSIDITSTKLTTKVKAVELCSIMSQYSKIDFLKMDIEGAENVVFPHCQVLLPRIESLFLEYHSKFNEPQQLDSLLKLLKINNFRYHIHPVLTSNRPFMQLDGYMDFDNQLNIFAWS